MNLGNVLTVIEVVSCSNRILKKYFWLKSWTSFFPLSNTFFLFFTKLLMKSKVTWIPGREELSTRHTSTRTDRPPFLIYEYILEKGFSHSYASLIIAGWKNNSNWVRIILIQTSFFPQRYLKFSPNFLHSIFFLKIKSSESN